jgi:hypothetical protein
VMVDGDAARTAVGVTPAPAVPDAATARSTHAVRSAVGRVRAGCRASFLGPGRGLIVPRRGRALKDGSWVVRSTLDIGCDGSCLAGG